MLPVVFKNALFTPFHAFASVEALGVLRLTTQIRKSFFFFSYFSLIFMTIKNYRFLFLGIIALRSVYSQGNKLRFDCVDSKYSFELGIKVYSDKESINVGGAIWFEENETTLNF